MSSGYHLLKFHRSRTATAQFIQDYASLIFLAHSACCVTVLDEQNTIDINSDVSPWEVGKDRKLSENASHTVISNAAKTTF